jgi:predicted enzyme involved in methoxymalonyl-ACP biosynthesis
VEQARQWGLATVTASYIPTAKNAMVKDFYARFDFRKTVEHADGRIDWALPVAEYTPRSVFIRADEER